MSSNPQVGELPITLHAQIPGGDMIKIGEVKVPIRAERSTLGMNKDTGTIYTLGINLEKTMKDIRSVFQIRMEEEAE